MLDSCLPRLKLQPSSPSSSLAHGLSISRGRAKNLRRGSSHFATNHHKLLLPRQDPPWRLRNRRRESSLQSARHGGRSSCNNGGFWSFCTSGPSPFG
ncbi:hypothetical protein IGI04_015079 [Brassica rapa subsp. trilocularis]|uniref:Uncharacterized protein n=1 Tax=Brassica rapa subsp. trilocularis TaxID=1813537 RepID=A0ABQ7MP12_BRACM|nr:hypothetical protein IGI04_015079 [Brassica rapa subsp. trilocularis]